MQYHPVRHSGADPDHVAHNSPLCNPDDGVLILTSEKIFRIRGPAPHFVLMLIWLKIIKQFSFHILQLFLQCQYLHYSPECRYFLCFFKYFIFIFRYVQNTPLTLEGWVYKATYVYETTPKLRRSYVFLDVCFA